MALRIHIRLVLWVIGLLGVIWLPVGAQQISPDHLQLYVQNDTLKIDVRIDSLFTQRALDAIESGMTASIAIQFRLMGAQNRQMADISHLARLEHDIWEGEYRLIRLHGIRDTLTFTELSSVSRTCSNLQNIPLISLPLPDRILTLQGRVQVDPISPEQQELTRKWLKILRKGSLLEFFFSFEDTDGQTRWIDLIQFHPNALPHLILEAQP
jgi:hypothetical protein